MGHAIAYFLELRTRFRRNPEARAIVDRCLWLIAEAKEADEVRLAELERTVDDLKSELVARFGPREPVSQH